MDPSPTHSGWRKRLDAIGDVASLIQSDLRFQYPWDGLESALRDRGLQGVSLVGYGSLLNPASAVRTIANTPPEGHPPVLACGARRIFDYVIPQSVIDRYQSQGAGEFPANQKAALNTRWTGSSSDVLNGRLIPLEIEDLKGLRERETGYDLEPVAVVPWDHPDSDPSLGFVLCATGRPWEGNVYIDPNIEPYPPYAEVCREGARVTGGEFEQCLIDTCWLADGVTPFASWLESH